MAVWREGGAKCRVAAYLNTMSYLPTYQAQLSCQQSLRVRNSINYVAIESCVCYLLGTFSQFGDPYKI